MALATTRGAARFSTSSSLIPERNLWDTIYSGTKGLISLLASEESRQKFMDVVQSTTINADVLKQARFGSMLTIALFHDLQDPLFQKYSFDASDFLTGVKPALTNFHETLGGLQNEFPDVTSKEEQTEKLLQRMIMQTTATEIKEVTTPWTEQADKDRQSPAGQLSTMVSPGLFNSLFLTAETEAMMATHKEGSTQVSYVALLSARAIVMDEEEDKDSMEDPTVSEQKEEVEAKQEVKEDKLENEVETKMEASANLSNSSEKEETSDVLKADSTPEDSAGDSKTETETMEAEDEIEHEHVAAAIEVLYEMNHTVDVKPNIFANSEGEGESQSPPTKTEREETQIWVGTFEGWLKGGPDGDLRWKITNWRPPTAEFPGLYHGFRST